MPEQAAPPAGAALSAVSAGAVRAAVQQQQQQQQPEQHGDAALRGVITQLQQEKLQLYRELEEQRRNCSLLQQKVSVLEQALRDIAQVPPPEPAAPPPSEPPPPRAPAAGAFTFDPALCGDGLDIGDAPHITARHNNMYNKLCLCREAADSEAGAYIEFTLDAPFPRFTSVGLVLESGLGEINLNTDSLGEHDFSYAWCAHKYWTAALVHDGQSRGPRGGDWAVGSRVGVLVRDGAVSFYLNGDLRHPHVFCGLSGPFRFAVGFGGFAEQESYGTISVVTGAPPPNRAASAG